MSETQTPPVERDPQETINELVARTKELTAELDRYKTDADRQKIIDQLGTAAVDLRIPAAVIMHDLPRYLPDFILKEGKAVAVQDETKDALAVLKQLQTERPHWQPTSQGGGSEPQRATHAANNYSAAVSQQAKQWFNN